MNRSWPSLLTDPAIDELPDAAGSSLLAFLRERAAAALGLPAMAIDLDRPLTALGLDSLSAVELQGAVEEALGVPLPLADLLAGATIRELAERLALQAPGGPPVPATPPVPPAGATAGDSPLSTGQRALWFLERLAPAAGAYNIVVAARARGLDVPFLRRALDRLVARHPALRTVFPTMPAAGEDEPVQRALPAADPPQLDFAVEDVTGWSEGRVRKRLAAEAWRPFDLARGPLLRVRLFDRGDGEPVLLLVVHHLVADFWSLGLLARELPTAGLPALSPLPFAYADFARREADRLAGPEGERLAGFWGEALAGERGPVPDLALPTDRPRPPVQSWRGLARGAELPADLTAALRRLAAEEGATLFALLAAGWQAQLGRYAGQEDFAVGTPTSGRGAPEWAGVVGYFVNPVALRADLAGDPPFRSLLARTRRTALAALEHAGYPFVLVAERLRPRRDPARPPVFQVLFTFQQGRPGDDPGLAAFALGKEGARIALGGIGGSGGIGGIGGIDLTAVALPERRAAFELSLAAAELPGGGLGLSLEASSDLFDAATVERMLGHFRTLLGAAVADPGRRLSELPLLTAPERQQVTSEWNDTATNFPPGALLPDLVAAQAARTPDAVAVVGSGGERLSYGGLLSRSRQIADRLAGMGIRGESRVGLCLSRTPDLIAGILGILEAGGAYVPLDPAYPRERLERMLADSGAAALVTESGLAGDLAFFSGPVVLLDRGVPPGLSGGNPVPPPGALRETTDLSDRNLAYVIYTSGSTGVPKGVGIEHRSAVTLIRWALEAFSPAELSGVLAATSVGFDLSVFEIFAPLAAGGKVILAPNVLALPYLAAAAEITLLNTVPSPLAELVDGPLPPGLRTVNLAGEALPPSLARRLYDRPGIERVVNLYGPTEDTTYSTVATVERGAAVAPIGWPLAGTRARVLDRYDGGLAPQPVGIPGELFLAGAGLARGYLGRPEPTAERFVPDPWGPPGSRMYRTGDRVRLRSDGQLDFLGRLDDQVKIRGIRIEPGEVAATLAGHPEVVEAAVLALASGPGGELRLSAFVAPSLPADLRVFAAARLPAAAIPTAWLALPALPRNSRGKVDRSALARDASTRADAADAATAAPRGPEEELLAGIWAELLGRARVGRHDDFFELGGHSLLATRAVARVSRRFGIDLPVSDLFAAPTVERFAARLAAVSRAVLDTGAPGAPPALVPLPHPPGEPLPLSFAQRRLWFLEQLTPGTAVYNLPGSVRLAGPLDVPALGAALAEVVRRHEPLRTVFRLAAGEPAAWVVPGVPLPPPIVDLAGLPAEARAAEAERRSRQEARRPFKLARGPLLRTLLLRLEPAEHLLLATFHHIVADGGSLVLFLDELAALYAADRPAVPPAELPVRYSDFAAWQAAWLADDGLAGELSYWRERLDGVPVLELPTDRSRPAMRDSRGATRALRLPPAAVAAVSDLARREGVTPFMAVLGAFQALLARWTGESVIPVGTAVANRRRPELERLIGLFVNSLVLAVPLGDDPAFGALLARVRQVCLGAYAHQDLPFERLVEELRPSRDLGQNPLFQVMLVFEEPLPARRSSGLDLEPVRGGASDTGTAKLDLLLAVSPQTDGSWELLAEHAAALWEPATIDRLLGHFQTLLAGATQTAVPSPRLSALPLLTAAERQQVSLEWNDTAAELPSGALLHDLVAAQAARTPDAVAVVGSEGERLSHGGLRDRSRQIAAQLVEIGIGGESRVGLCLARTPDLIAGILGILEAGGAYVPLDPAYPRERLERMLVDSGAEALLTEPGLAGDLAFFPGPVVLLDRGVPPGLSGENPVPPPGAGGGWVQVRRGALRETTDLSDRNLAYIIYTSGSTGVPKGVGIEHRSAVTLIRWALEAFSPAELSGVLAATSVSFDLSIFEIFAPLAAGGTVILAPNVLALPHLAAAAEITLVNTVPSALAELADGPLPPSLKTVNLAGEALPPSLAQRLYARSGIERVVNLYGPSEDITYSTAANIAASERGAGIAGMAPIGRPLAGTRARVLDRQLAPLPVGVPGELFLAGAGLARGYLGRPEPTAERFLPDPWGPPGSRMYRTGDRVRLRSDGQLDFLGRLDDPVKIRGVRIEISEIEAHLARYPTVLAGIFREVLGLAAVGIDDNFFDLGGHSLLAVRAAFAISAAFGVELPVGALFEAPTVAALTGRLALLSPLPPSEALEPTVDGPADEAPLSLAQQRLWFHWRLAPESALFNLSVSLRLTGRLDADALDRALAEIVRRHEPLRTVYRERDGEPVQVVLPSPTAPLLSQLSLAGLPEGVRQEALAAVLKGEESLPFDLERGPVARFRRVELGPAEHVLVATFHHIATDGWSMGVFARELSRLYGAPSSPLPEPLRYVDFARQQRRELQRGAHSRQLDFWRQRLAGIPVLELPADRRPPQPGSHGASLAFDLPADLTAALFAFGRGDRGGGLTPFQLLLAGFAALLARLSGQDDFGIGVPSAGRNRAETAGMIGFFVNTLVLRPELGDDPPFAELARRVRDFVLAAQANEEVPFERLVEELQPERTPGVPPLFQVMFAFLQEPLSLTLPGLTVSLLERDPPFAEFDLTLSILEWEGRLRGGLLYRTDLFDAPTVARWGGHLRTLLAAAAADPGRPLSSLPLLSAAESWQLREWSGAPVPTLPITLHRRFEEQALRTPDAVALLAGESAVSYGELEAGANRLARHLLALGVAAEDRIAVCLPRSPELDRVLLAVLKSGGVHLPLDPSYPPERMRILLEDAGATVLVSREAEASQLPLDGLAGGPPKQVLLDRDVDAAAISRRSAAQLTPAEVEVDPRGLAYIIYTSGSTGRPKGVGVPHGAAAAHVDAVRRAYGIGPRDRALQFSSPGFDVSIEQVLVALGAGAALVVRGDDLWSPHELTRRIRRLGLTAMDLPTAYWHRWASDPGEPEDFSGGDLPLRVVVAGGEEMLAGNVRQWMRSPLAAARLLNGYGPTEVVVTVTLHEVRPEDGAAAVVPLGRPVLGNSVWVLDRAGQPQPPGIPGELTVGGPKARGYLGRPEQTAARFVPDPFSGLPGARLYRTGDRARSRPDGRLEFLGRLDEQVKVRGFRIELGEIEAALTRHPAVRQATVLAVAVGAAGEVGAARTLAAWVVPALAGDVGADLFATLRADLLRELPEYMVPTAWVTLNALPLNAHGKVDRRALPPPEAMEAGETVGTGLAELPPIAPEVELLAGLYAELLGRPRVGAGESFFDLGGHSLLATQLASRVRAAFGLELPLAAIFDHPTPAALALRLRAFRAEATPAAPPPLLPTGDLGDANDLSDPAPLSFAQQRLWFLHQLEPDDAYHVPGALRLRGRLDEAVLADAFREIVRRHAALRTVFRSGSPGGDAPVQVVLSPFAPELPAADLTALPAALREAEAARLLAAEGRRPFDLADGPLLRSLLLRLAPEERLLSVVMHHITSDAWSLGVLLRELQALYSAGLQGAPSPLPELPIQYPDFARWQRRWLTGEVLEREVEHWRRTLEGAPESLPLPYDRPPAPGAGNGGGRRPFALGSDLYGGLTALARRFGWTAFMGLLAGFQALLSRYTSGSTGGEDLVVGSPIANRTQRELEGLIGFFTNTLALRLDPSGDPSFREIGRRVRAVALDAYAHQDLPFEKLVLELAPDRHLGRNPLFQVMLVLQRLPAPPVLPGVAVELVDVDTGTAKFDLTLQLAEEGDGGASGGMEYACALFDAATVDRLLVHLQTLLEGAVAAPESPLSELPLLSAAERAELAAWTRPRNPVPPPLLVHAEVLAQAARTPDVMAVTAAVTGEHLSYGELARRARRLARRLRAGGVGPDVPVGLYLERSLDMMVGVLGVLVAGGAYLPLDPSYPAERLRTMLEDARVPVLVTHGPLLRALPRGEAQIVRVDEAEVEDVENAGDLSDASNLPPSADSLAYLVYTSGSTGRPKGVAMSHGAISAMLLWQLRTSAAGAGRTLQFTSLAFDVSFQEIFATWWAGGTLVLVGEDVRRDPPALTRLLAEEQVERLFLPFVALQQVALAALETDGEAFPASLREVMSAGEQLHVTPQVAALFARLPGAALYNHYGPSETHAVTGLDLTGDPALWPERPAIGGPVDHARVFLLDAGFQPVPAGVPGEVWVGGAGLARGYLGRPELTAERFLPDPFDWAAGFRPGDRLYRTGDLARRRPEGVLEFLGRADAQVKIRGHRVELGEVEAALARHPAIEQAAVGARRAGSDRRLTAYVVLKESVPPPSFRDLRAFLAESLPDPMIPTAWARLDGLPLTATGKLDRRALSRLAPEEDSGEDRPFAPPENPVEELLAAIWREVLGVSRVGRDDDFFALGGHSLLATQVASRLRHTFALDLPLRRLFEARTLADLAAVVREGLAGTAGAGEPSPPLRREPRTGDLPLSFAQERLWFLDRLQPGGSAYNIPLVLRAAGRIDPLRLEAALAKLVSRQEVLRTVFAERDGVPAQIVLPVIRVPVPVADLSALPPGARAAESRRVATEAAERPFDLARGPLLRALLVSLAPAEGLLVVGLHHIAADGWSLGVLVREVRALYAGESLPELPIQYVDFALWQRRRLSGETLDRQLAWWRERLSGAPRALALPADHPRPPVQTQRGAELGFELPSGLVGRLTALAAGEGATLFMVLLSGLYALLARLSGETDLIVGSPIANRNQREIEGLIGFFVNTLALRADLSRAATFGELLRQVREMTLGAYAHQDLPFEKLVEELQTDRDLSRSPVFQVAFALQNAPLPAADLGGVRLIPEEIPGGVAKFDLSFVLTGDAGDDGNGGLQGTLQYATDLFAAPTAARWAGHLTALLESLAAEPEAPLETAALLVPAERQQVLVEWNDTRSLPEGSSPSPVHELVAEQARRRPEALAISSPAGRLTYGELLARADRLARRLRALGVGPEVRVALCADRTPARIVGALAVLRAGGAFVSLDPTYPAERLAFVVDDARAPVLLTEERFLDRLPATLAVVLGLDRLDEGGDEGGEASSDLPIPPTLTPESLAYLVYTSGSTGRPKGVATPHNGLSHLVHWYRDFHELTPEDRGTQVASPAFDASIFEVWPYLAAGASVHIPDDAVRLSAPEMLRFWEEEGITVSFLPTPLAEGVLEELAERESRGEKWPGDGLRLRTLLTGGDRLRRRPSPGIGFRLVNHYGPAENSVAATGGEVTPTGVAVGDELPGIGVALDDTRIVLLDRWGGPVPLGVAGEIHLAGPGLARGYLGRPDLTAERFLPECWSDWNGSPGGRMYRTGDLARRRPDGSLDFLGRVDHQVKVRGHRIELQEIERALAHHPGVREAVVAASEEASGDKRLVGYVVPRDGEVPEDELRAFLLTSLPESMVPWSFVTLAALPVTPNGKLDRAALPAPSAPSSETAALAYVAPRNDLERAIGAVWCEVLGRERVGVEESFFRIGGNSLLLARLQTRLRLALGRDIPMVELFRHPTIAGLAKSLGAVAPGVEEREGREARGERVRARTESRRESMRQVEQRAERRRKERPREPGR
jgi:amino acid adenylation domain-containing protein